MTKSGFTSGWDYDDAPRNRVHGGKMTARQAVERIEDLECAVFQAAERLKTLCRFDKRLELAQIEKLLRDTIAPIV